MRDGLVLVLVLVVNANTLYCPGRPKKLCFTTLSLAPAVLTARLCVVKQSFFGLPGQYGHRVTKANYSERREVFETLT